MYENSIFWIKLDQPSAGRLGGRKEALKNKRNFLTTILISKGFLRRNYSRRVLFVSTNV